MTAVRTRAIDTSHHNGSINWGLKKRQQGIAFGMAKCVEGLAFFDTQYVANREGCHLAGLPFVAYAYVRPEAGSALAQAKYLIQKAGQVEGLCMDLEKSALSQSDTNAWMRAYGDNLRALAPGITTFAYLGGYAANGSGQSAVNHFDRWIYPHYLMRTWPTLYTPKVGSNTTGWAAPPAPHVWQCSDNIGGTDADVSDLTVPQLFSSVQPRPPTPPGHPTEDDPMFLASLKSSPAQYISDGLQRRWVPAPSYRDWLVEAGLNPHVYEFDTLAGLEAMAGPLVPGTPDYDPTKG